MTKPLKTFLDELLTFPADITLGLSPSESSVTTPLRLAASGYKPEKDLTRIGLLVNSGQNVLARVFRNKSRREYQLYFVNNDSLPLEGGIISVPESFKYFLINDQDQTSIPFSAGIDPLKTNILITLPRERFILDLSSGLPAETLALTGTSFSVTVTPDPSSWLTFRLKSPGENESITKLILWASPDRYHLVPFRNHEASTEIGMDFFTVVRILLYP